MNTPIDNLRSNIENGTYDHYMTFDSDTDYCHFAVIAARRQLFKRDLISALNLSYPDSELNYDMIAEIVDVAWHDYKNYGYMKVLDSAIIMCRLYVSLNLKCAFGDTTK